MTTTCTMILGDCLDVMPTLPKRIAGFCFADLPYAITGCEWDKALCVKDVWAALGHVSSPNGCNCLTAVQPFTSKLIVSNLKKFRNEIIWIRHQSRGFFNAKRQPMRKHENIIVFGTPPLTYNPVMCPAKDPRKYGAKKASKGVYGKTGQYGSRQVTLNYPVSVIQVDEADLRHDTLHGHKTLRIHPTQKPVALLDWLIRTYSNAGDMVLDPTAGSFTTCVSACSNGRSSIGIERDEGYFEAGVERVRKHIRDNLLDVKLEVRK